MEGEWRKSEGGGKREWEMEMEEGWRRGGQREGGGRGSYCCPA